MLLTITNLYPRPDDPQRGLFNAQFFNALFHEMKPDCTKDPHIALIRNICLVPSWRIAKWPVIRGWSDPLTAPYPTLYMPVFYMPVIGRSLNWLTYSHALRKAEEDAMKCDAILATWLYPDATACARLARKVNKPLWIKVHGSDIYHLSHSTRRKQILATCSQAAGIFCVAQWLKDKLTASGVDPSKIHVLPNGVDTNKFHHQDREKARWKITGTCEELAKPKTRVVLFAGYLTKVKGPDILIRAWSRLNRAGERTILVMIGKGRLKKKLEKLADKLNISDSVKFITARTHEEMPYWLNAADCLCLPSRSEGMPNIVLESLACGTPVVGTNVGEMSRLINEKNGELVSAKSNGLPERLALAINNTLHKQWNREAITASIAAFTWKNTARTALDKIMRQ